MANPRGRWGLVWIRGESSPNTCEHRVTLVIVFILRIPCASEWWMGGRGPSLTGPLHDGGPVLQGTAEMHPREASGRPLRQNAAWGRWRGCIRTERGGGGMCMYQKWPDKIFPMVNFVFPHLGTLVWGRGGITPPSSCGVQSPGGRSKTRRLGPPRPRSIPPKIAPKWYGAPHCPSQATWGVTNNRCPVKAFLTHAATPGSPLSRCEFEGGGVWKQAPKARPYYFPLNLVQHKILEQKKIGT